MTYVLARAFDTARARRGGGPATARLEQLFRDAVRYLVASGATLAEVQGAVQDVCEGADAWNDDPELRVALGALEAGACAFARALTAGAAREPLRPSNGRPEMRHTPR